MNRMVVYSVANPEGLTYYPTKPEAIAEAKKEAAVFRPEAGEVEVRAHYISDAHKRRRLHALLLNGAGWCVEEELVAKFPCTGTEIEP